MIAVVSRQVRKIIKKKYRNKNQEAPLTSSKGEVTVMM